MAQMAPSRGITCCCRRAVQFTWSQPQQRRTIVSLHAGPVEKLQIPPGLPQQYWSQLPKRLRPEEAKRKIKIFPSLKSEATTCKEPIKLIEQQQIKLLDPNGARTRLFDPKNAEGAKAGDIIMATFKTGEPFSGVAMSIKWRGPHTSVLLRNQLTRVGTEMDIKVFSPLVKSMEIVQKAVKRPRRARLFYLRKPTHDVGSVQKIVDDYMRRRSTLVGGQPQGGNHAKIQTARRGARGGPRR